MMKNCECELGDIVKQDVEAWRHQHASVLQITTTSTTHNAHKLSLVHKIMSSARPLVATEAITG